jgi:Cu(I)/Ag(I) efflux system membrane fusion protein
MNRITLIGIITGGALLVIAVGGWFFITGNDAPPAEPERKVLYWTDPMVPGYRSDKPGKSPFMDMELVPIYEDTGAGPEGAPAITVSPQVVQRLGVRTTTVIRNVAMQRLNVTGYLFRQGEALVVIADVFDRNTAWLKPGLPAEVRVADLPGVRFAARVERIESDRDIGGRSVKVRVRLLNPDLRLQANMAAEVHVSAATERRALLVPREALIRTARRNALIRVLDDGRFQPVEVVAGEEFGEQVEIRSGVAEGDKIVVSGQFLIDSEASVRESLKRMDSDPAPAAGSGQHQH